MYHQLFQGEIVYNYSTEESESDAGDGKGPIQTNALVRQKLAGIIDLQDLRGCWKNGRRLQHTKANVS